MSHSNASTSSLSLRLSPERSRAALIVGRYELFDVLGVGGSAIVHIGRLHAPGGFVRTVAIKRLKTELVYDAQACESLLEEARVLGRISSPHVVAAVDVVRRRQGDPFLVMEYIEGDTLARLLRASGAERMPPQVAVAIALDTLRGLHAAHEATDERGGCLDVTHADVSPENLMVGTDGLTRVYDFGTARARDAELTVGGRGKLRHLAPEQLTGQRPDRRSDVYGVAVVLWEMLVGRMLFDAVDPAENVTRILGGTVVPPRMLVGGIGCEVEAVVLRGLALHPRDRFETAAAMEKALAVASRAASASDVAAWVRRTVPVGLARRAAAVRMMDREDKHGAVGSPSTNVGSS